MLRVSQLRRGIQFVLVTVGIVLLTSFSIDATDTLRSSQTALGIFAQGVVNEDCPAGMETVSTGELRFCIDTYEAGVGDTCIVAEPKSPSETALNAVDADCEVISQSAVLPWRFVTSLQAEQLCARVGKRLPTAQEWYQAALGTIDSAECNTAGTLQPSGKNEACRSGSGAFDMVGNVWEFVQGGVLDGELNRNVLPGSGYVSAVNGSGVPTESSTTPQVIFNDDYIWSSAEGSFAVMRGGYYGSGSDGGLYSMHAMITRDFSSGAIGFRCAKSL